VAFLESFGNGHVRDLESEEFLALVVEQVERALVDGHMIHLVVGHEDRDADVLGGFDDQARLDEILDIDLSGRDVLPA
jgi:hypothetical protein